MAKTDIKRELKSTLEPLKNCPVLYLVFSHVHQHSIHILDEVLSLLYWYHIKLHLDLITNIDFIYHNGCNDCTFFENYKIFRKYFRNWHFFRKYFQNVSKILSNFESIFEKSEYEIPHIALLEFTKFHLKFHQQTFDPKGQK